MREDSVPKLLSSLMRTKDDTYVEDVFAKLTVEQVDMVSPSFGHLYAAIIHANDATNGKDRSVDMIESVASRKSYGEGTLQEAMRSRGITRSVMERIAEEVVTESSGKEYLEAVLREAMGITLNQAAIRLIEVARDMSIPTGGLLAEVDRLVTNATTMGGSNLKHARVVSDQIWRVATGGEPPKNRRIRSGNRMFDKYFGGHNAGKVIVVTAPPQNSKTTYFQNLIFYPLHTGEMAVAYFAREDDDWSIIPAMISQASDPRSPWLLNEKRPGNTYLHVDRVKEIGQGEGANPTKEELLVLKNAKGIVSKMDMYIDAVSRSPQEMRATIRRIVRMHPDKFVLCIVDYIQLSGTEGKTEIDRLEEVTQFVRDSMTKELAQRGGWIVTSQLDKSTTSNAGKIASGGQDIYPDEAYQMAGMKGSSTIEQFADGIIGTLMPSVYQNGPESLASANQTKEEINITVFKNKIRRKRGRGKQEMDTRTGVISDVKNDR